MPKLLQSSEQIESDSYAPGWRLVRNFNSKELNRIITQAGWNFFCLADGIEMIAYGTDMERITHKIVRRIIVRLKKKSFNCLEIRQVTAKRFLGVPYVSVSACSRHVQKGQILFAD